MSATLAVDEALKRNETLTSAKAKLEATIVSLKKVQYVTPRHRFVGNVSPLQHDSLPQRNASCIRLTESRARLKWEAVCCTSGAGRSERQTDKGQDVIRRQRREPQLRRQRAAAPAAAAATPHSKWRSTAFPRSREASVTVWATFCVCVQEAKVNEALMEENVSAREEKQVQAGPAGQEENAVNPCQCQRQCVGL